MDLMLHLILLCSIWLKPVQLVNVHSPIWNSPQAKFQETLDYLKNATKLDESPCANFYGYSCGNYGKNFKTNSPGVEMFLRNVQLLLPKFNKPESNELKSIQLAKRFFGKCVEAGAEILPSDIHALLAIFKEFESITGIPFPPLARNDDQLSLNSTQIAKALAFLESKCHIVPPETHAVLFRSLPTLFLQATTMESAQKDKKAYILPITVRPTYCQRPNNDVEQMQIFIDTYQKQVGNISSGLIESTLQDLTQFIQTIKNELCDESEGFDLQHVMENIRHLKPFTASEFNSLFHSFDAKTFIQEFTKTASQEVKSKLLSENFTVYANIDKFRKIDSLIFGPTPKISGRQLANHFYMSIISFRWKIPALTRSEDESDYNTVINHRYLHKRKRGALAMNFYEHNGELTEMEVPVEMLCLLKTGALFRFAYDRIYIDARSDKEDLKIIRAKISQLVQYVIGGFRSMVDQVGWLTPNSKEKARKKLDNMALNLLYNNISMDDAKLEEYYGSLIFGDNETIYQMFDSVKHFLLEKNLQKLVKNVADRHELNPVVFNADIVNDAYYPYHNSINIFLGDLQTPNFDVNWPMEWNFGSIGSTIGHEISHGFDNQGVLFDESGYYAPWMEPPTEEAFNKMGKCVTDQYSKYYICDNTTDPLNGTHTLGENIADNAGIHAAFRGYQHWKDTVGEEPGLPPTEGPLGQLKDDQLFFLANSQFWCEKLCSYDTRDVHSPSKVRVHGTLSNFPAFHNAFDCKIGDEYRPKDKCDVWITDVMHKRFMTEHHI
ncbi:peptidase family m13 domain-containing protein [Ditylenchus destructor]|uniref:Peptidase family m13 domain-containing protein n=1 Tax=Ditylenchus destructor TaxID=166010 RepID=A0AAD4MLY8_9BILA|nr:peptidase family m13 domain-containing protein [Ditylenchus destructor]